MSYIEDLPPFALSVIYLVFGLLVLAITIQISLKVRRNLTRSIGDIVLECVDHSLPKAEVDRVVEAQKIFDSMSISAMLLGQGFEDFAKSRAKMNSVELDYPGLLDAVTLSKAKADSKPYLVSLAILMTGVLFLFIIAFIAQDYLDKRFKEAEIESVIQDSVSDNFIGEIMDLTDLTAKLQASDSITEVRNISGEIAQLATSIDDELKVKQEAIAEAADNLDKTRNAIARESEALSVLRTLSDAQRASLERFFFAEARESGERTFWLGLAFAFLVQLFVQYVVPSLVRLFRRQEGRAVS